MPRGPRLDVPDALYHVVARGVERRPVFRDDADRDDFLRRLAVLSTEEEICVFAYALMDNHFHLVVRRGPRPLGGFMRRLLTGYSGRFNRRHQRVGHLFQNRFKSVLCDTDSYLTVLVRYVHLNPVRAGIVTDPAAYPWSSHTAYTSRRPPEWLDTGLVLELLGGRRAYREFVAAGAGELRRPEFSGEQAPAAGDDGLWIGRQVLGDEEFARRQLQSRAELAFAFERGDAEALPTLAAEVAARFGVSVELLRGRGRALRTSAARRALVAVAVQERGVRPVDVSRYLNLSTAAVAQHLRALERRRSN